MVIFHMVRPVCGPRQVAEAIESVMSGDQRRAAVTFSLAEMKESRPGTWYDMGVRRMIVGRSLKMPTALYHCWCGVGITA